jgi:hypothetical protein
MRIVPQVVTAMQAVFGVGMDELGRQTGCVQRQRKLSGSTLIRMLVLTLLQYPAAKDRHYRAMAGKLGVCVSEQAIAHRFTSSLVCFLEEVLRHALTQTLRASRVATGILQKFSDVRVGDSTTLRLPDAFATQWPGCGGTGNAGRAALKIQVLWSLVHGQLLKLLWEPGRTGDRHSEIAEILPPARSLSLFDLGYFALERFRRLEEVRAYWISRFQQNTALFDAAAQPLNLLRFLRKSRQESPVDMAVLLGVQERLAARLIAVPVPPEVAARRRQKIREKAADHGRTASREYLALQGWTIFLTNCGPELLTWKEVVVLYRARWQIELLFKLWKSHNRLAQLEVNASPERQMAVLYAKLIAVIVQHWLLLITTWHDGRRSLRKAAAILRDWAVLFSNVLDSRRSLQALLERIVTTFDTTARVNRRRKRPSLFQLLENPELLEYTVA